MRRPWNTEYVARRCAIALVVCAAACDNPASNPPPPPPPGGHVLVGAGDIAACNPGAEATARLLDLIDGTVFTAGDNAYPSGREIEFLNCYEPTWGRHKARTFPTPGNHDYETPGASAYFSYFGSSAGQPGQGYNRYNVGTWRVYALNSEISMLSTSPQVQWLRNDLRTNPVPCTIAIFHRPLFTSGPNGDNVDTRDMVRALYDNNVDIIVNGHDHLYERFARMDPDGRVDRTRGFRQFIVGTGGVPLYVPAARKPTSEVLETVWGVIKFTLSEGSYSWQFVPVRGSESRTDSGSDSCH